MSRLGCSKSVALVARLINVKQVNYKDHQKSEEAIKASVANGTGTSAKVTCIPHDPIMEKGW